MYQECGSTVHLHVSSLDGKHWVLLSGSSDISQSRLSCYSLVLYVLLAPYMDLLSFSPRASSVSAQDIVSIPLTPTSLSYMFYFFLIFKNEIII